MYKLTDVDLKIISTGYFITKKDFFGEKEKGCNPVPADIASYMHILASVPRWKGIQGREKRS